MKLKHFIFLLLILKLEASHSQNRFFQIIGKYDKTSMLPNEHIMQLVSLGSSSKEEMFFIAKSNKEDSRIVALIHSLGFLVNEKDQEIVQFIENLSMDEDIFHFPAVQAIYRIGGFTLKRFLDNAFIKDDFRIQHKILENTWGINRLADLVLIENKVCYIKENFPEWGISKYIDKTYLPRLEVAIQVLKFPNREESRLALKSIIESKHGYFRGVSGGIGLIWAMKTLYEITPDEERGALEAYLNTRRPLSLKAVYSPVAEALFYFIHKSGGELTDHEIEWLRNTRGGFTSYAITLLRSKEELMNYYAFRKQILN